MTWRPRCACGRAHLNLNPPLRCFIPWPQADFDSAWCTVDDPARFEWQHEAWDVPPHDAYLIYQLHVGSWTPEGTLQAAREKLAHVRAGGRAGPATAPCHAMPWALLEQR